MQLCLNRFDVDTKTSFLDLYTKVDAGASAEQIMTPPTVEEVKPTVPDEIPF